MRNMLVRLIEMGLGTILVISALIHIAGPWFFLEAATRYRILPVTALVWVLPFLMAIQLVSGTALVFGLFRGGVLWVAGGLFACFLLAQVCVLCRGIQVICGCFGSASHAVSVWSVLQLTAMLFLVIMAMRMRQKIDLFSIPRPAKE